MKKNIALLRAAIVMLLLTAACSTGKLVGSSGTAKIDWEKPAVELGGGWSLADEPGDGPFIAVSRDGERVSTIEMLRYDISTLDEIREKLADGATVREALAAHVAEFYEIIEQDRVVGCPTGYRFEADDPGYVEAKDGTVVRYGFTATKADGTPSERSVHFAGLRKDHLILIGMNASHPDGCMPAEGDTFTEESLNAFAPVLEAAIIRSGLPKPSSTAFGPS